MSDDRFWSKVQKNADGCWEWLGTRNPNLVVLVIVLIVAAFVVGYELGGVQL